MTLRGTSRLTVLAGVLLVGITLASCVAVFLVMRAELDRSVETHLQAAWESRFSLFETVIEKAYERSSQTLFEPWLWDAAMNRTNVTELTHRLHNAGYSGIHLTDPAGRVQLNSGYADHPTRQARLLSYSLPVYLIHDGQYKLRTEYALGRGKARLILEQPLPELTERMVTAPPFRESEEWGLCYGVDDRTIECFPQRRNPQGQRVARYRPDGEAVPVQRALSGETGLIRGTDYRGNDVVAVEKLLDTGLVLLLKVDTRELYDAVHDKLRFVVLMMLAVGLIGLLLVRFSIHPRVQRIQSELSASRRSLAETSDRAGRELRDSETRFHQLADAMPQIVWMARPDGCVDYYNRRWYELTGATAGVTGDDSWLHAVHPDDRERCMNAWYQSVRTGDPYRIEFRLRFPHNEEYRWHLARALPARDKDGRIVRWYGTATDVHGLKVTEQALRRSSEELELAIAGSGGARWEIVFDPSRPDVLPDEIRISARMKHFLGYAELELPNSLSAWYARIHPDDVEHVRASQQAHWERRTPCHEVDYRIRHRNGTWRWLSCSGRIMREDDGKPLRWVGIDWDITDRKEAEQSLKEAARRKDEFLATLAHELRNPLAPVSNALELLRVAGDNRALTEQARAILDRQLKQMVRLIDDLLDMSRITTGKLQLRMERVELGEVVRGAIEATAGFCKAREQALNAVPNSRPLYLFADAARLTQVLTNLLRNAAKYTRTHGEIFLTVREEGSTVCISVCDTGIGIPPDKLDAIFEMFSQVEGSRESSDDGLGIGLYLAKRLVELHEGSITARSAGKGRGSEFAVRLPLAPQREQERSAQTKPHEKARRFRILVVDDNVDAAETLTALLQIMGHEVRTAYDGAEGIAVADEFRPEIVLLDLGMPKLDGFEAARQIRTRPWGEDAFLAAVSGWGKEEDKRKTAAAGFDDHFTKPVDPGVLAALLASLSHGRHRFRSPRITASAA